MNFSKSPPEAFCFGFLDSWTFGYWMSLWIVLICPWPKPVRNLYLVLMSSDIILEEIGSKIWITFKNYLPHEWVKFGYVKLEWFDLWYAEIRMYFVEGNLHSGVQSTDFWMFEVHRIVRNSFYSDIQTSPNKLVCCTSTPFPSPWSSRTRHAHGKSQWF